MNVLTLSFIVEARHELLETSFRHPTAGEIRCIRGKTAGAYPNQGNFQWTKAVAALCILMLRGIVNHRAPGSPTSPILMGEAGSLAASLDYALSKQPEWVGALMGQTANGRSLLRKYIGITNSGRKRVGAVHLRLTDSFLEETEVQILVNDTPVTDTATLIGLADAIERETAPEGSERAPIHLVVNN